MTCALSRLCDIRSVSERPVFRSQYFDGILVSAEILSSLIARIMTTLDFGSVSILIVYLISYLVRAGALAIRGSLEQLSLQHNATAVVNYAQYASPSRFNSISAYYSRTLNVTAPTPRLGFHINFVTNQSQALVPLEVYQNAMQMMYVLAIQPKEGLIERSMGMSDESFKTACGIFPLTDKPLETNVAVTALYQTALHIATNNAYYGVEAPFSIGSLHVGTVRFFTIESAATKPTFVSDARVAAPRPNELYATSRPNQGFIRDDRDPEFLISYAYDGVRMQSKEIFTAFLNALAISSEHENTDLQAGVAAAPSAGGDVILSTWTLGEDEESKMTWQRLKRALLVLWGRLVVGEESERPRFEGLRFGFVFDGVSIGGGALIKIVGGGEDDGSGGTALSR